MSGFFFNDEISRMLVMKQETRIKYETLAQNKCLCPVSYLLMQVSSVLMIDMILNLNKNQNVLTQAGA